uniref:T9SS type A sorting domain-containing protein n=1 Tax=uncultured Tenacibaculum sp. TaxID=174713 RepID=UPI00261654E1
TVDLSAYKDNTDNQNLSLSGNNIQISGGNSLDLSDFKDNTDNQNLTFSGTSLSIANGNSVDLAALKDGTGTDNQNLTAKLNGNTLQIEIENGNSVSVDLSPILAAQEATIKNLINRIEKIEKCACNGTLPSLDEQKAKLFQNVPNPYTKETKIPFVIPDNITNAYIKIHNYNGQFLQKIRITQRGKKHIIFDNDFLSSGVYIYSLYTNGIKVDSKKMIIK